MATLKLGSAHIAIVVKNIDKALKFYSKAFGIKFEEVQQYDLPLPGHPDLVYRDKPSKYTMKVTFGQMGPVRVEMVQVLQGKCIYTDFLDKKGEGIQHLGFDVDDLEKEVINAKSQGLKMISQLKMFGIMAFAYFDPKETNGVTIELVQKDVQERLMKKLAEGG
jgi:methylmalonyl-CoA/ethylmalonyl-CoA epimerase